LTSAAGNDVDVRWNKLAQFRKTRFENDFEEIGDHGGASHAIGQNRKDAP
jgi:hypothetical protein